jgi:NAD(P)H dehydrogenase (quinone)
MKILLVVVHPRENSLTAGVAEIFAAGVQKNGHPVERANLIQEGFDPVLREEDEPDWNNPRKEYSPEVRREMERINRNDATVMIFPVYWWSLPGVLKGWIDRVWNNGWAYGDASFPQRRVWMIGIAGNTANGYTERGYDGAMSTQLDVGVLDYCGVQERRLELLYGSIEGQSCVDQILIDAERLAAEF